MAMEMHSRPPLVGAPAPAPAMVTAPNMGVHALSPQHGATAPYNGLGGQLGTALPTHGAALGARQAPVGSPSPAIVGGLPGDAGARLPPVGAAELTLPTEPTQNDVATTEPGKMFVGGLSPETTRDRLKDYFSRFGEVVDCVVMTDAETGRTRGFGFVTFRDGRCCSEVLRKRPHLIDGREVDPKMAVPREEMDGQVRQRPVQGGQSTPCKVFVGGLPPSSSDDSLKTFFSQFGVVDEAVVIYDKQFRTPRGFGFVTFADPAVATKIVQDHFFEFEGKQVEVKQAEPKPTPRRRTHPRNPRHAQSHRGPFQRMPPFPGMFDMQRMMYRDEDQYMNQQWAQGGRIPWGGPGGPMPYQGQWPGVDALTNDFSQMSMNMYPQMMQQQQQPFQQRDGSTFPAVDQVMFNGHGMQRPEPVGQMDAQWQQQRQMQPQMGQLMPGQQQQSGAYPPQF
eukprot:m.19703 g.19703  ORF g.19703 m.19703 type:complete len:450 (+) comp8067_c0_seq2:359-1708(+)